MRKVILFIAMSLDGYLADRSGGVGWLGGQDEGGEDLDTYSDFVKGVDTVVMGWNTYRQIVAELSPHEWVYRDLTAYVVTHRALPSTDLIKFTQRPPCRLVEELRREPGKAVWICGGGNLIQPLLRDGLIDEFHISVIPTLLGGGIRLFEELPEERKLRLTRTRTGNGIVELIYTRR